eukprot:587711-Hanusia_phi.AAC.1
MNPFAYKTAALFNLACATVSKSCQLHRDRDCPTIRHMISEVLRSDHSLRVVRSHNSAAA